MSAIPLGVLIVTESKDDRALAALVLRQEYAEVEVLHAQDALEFADHLAGGGFSVVLVDQELSWADGVAVFEAIERRYNECAGLLLVGDPAELEPPESIDVVVPKTSRGFVELPKAIERARRVRRARFQKDVDVGAYERLIGELPVGVFALSTHGVFTQANRLAVDTLGFPDRDHLLGRLLVDLIPDIDLRSRCVVLLERAQPLRDLDVMLRRVDGGKTKVSLSFWPVLDARGELNHFEGAMWDLSAIAAAGGAGPSEVNMEHLAAAVSHDLQDPLQLIAQYARLLMERHARSLDNDALRLVSRVTESAARMQSMIDGILEFSSVASGGRPFQVVDMNNVIGDAIGNLMVRIEETGARVLCDDLPSVVGEPRQLIQLFQNLIGNAIKFHGRVTPMVKISHEERKDDWLVSISDNGIGMDPASVERIFDMFQRLHTSEEFPGRGIGLAICKRIAGGHGGRIWVESTPGEGSTFFVTLAKEVPGKLSNSNFNRRVG